MNIDKYSLGTKIYVSQSFTAGLLVLLGAASIFSLTRLESSVGELVSNGARKLELTGHISTSIAVAQGAQRGVVLGALTGNTAQTEDARRRVTGASDQLKKSLAEIEPLIRTEEGQRLYQSLHNSAASYHQSLTLFEGHLQAQRFDEATKMQADVFTPLLEKMLSDSQALADLQTSIMAAASQSARTETAVSLWLTIGLCLLAGVVSIAAFWVIRGANVDLRRIANEIAEGSRQVASAAQQVSSSSQALAQGSSEQAATLEETSASTEEINSMTQKNAENASNAAVETEKADLLLKETDQKLTQMIESMREINTSSEKIGKIIRVIDEIAFQTNILALNAAVEAARAGEAGMGFAVVADEVRNLAQRCAQAAKDTSDLIEESIVRSNDGKVRLDEVAACVTKVFDNASRIKVLSNEVHVGSQEQARGIEQIARAVAQMQQVTQSTAASAEEGASAGEEMSAQAHTLHDAVDRLRDLVGGGEESQPARKAVTALPRKPALTTAAAAHHHRAPAPALVAAAKPPAPAKSQIPLDDDFSNF